MKWEELSSPEVQGLPRDTVVVLPLGAIEQHGPHLPIGTDSLIVEGIVEALDHVFDGKLLVLPTQRIGCSDHHRSFAGTLTVRHETLLAVILETLGMPIRHGFRRFLVLNSHGGNRAIGEVIAQQAAAQWPEAEVVFATWWQVCASELAGLAEGEFRGVCHACEFETSLMLVLHPRLVNMALAKDAAKAVTASGERSETLRASTRATLAVPFERLSESGVVGRPTLARADKGQRILEAAVKDLRDLLQSCWPSGAPD